MAFQFTQRSQNIPSSGIHAMMEIGGKFSDAISLGQGTPYFPTPPFIYDAVMKQAQKDQTIGMYAQPSQEIVLKQLIAQKMKSVHGFSPDTNDIVLTVGGVAALMSALMAFIEPGDEIIYFDPSYPIHLSQIHLVQGVVRFVSYKEEDGWRFPVEKLNAAITQKTKAILLTNPNNPTGTILSKEELTALTEIIVSHNMLLILDEAYEYLTYDTLYTNPLSIPELRAHTILAKSFSKEYAMTGWRIGYAWAPTPIATLLKQIHLNLNIAVPTVSLYAGIAALSDPLGEQFIHTTQAVYTKSRDTIHARLQNLPNLFSSHLPSGAYYAFPRIIPDIDAKTLAIQLVNEAHVITIPGDPMGPAGTRHLRLSFCLPPEIINTAFDRIDTFASAHGWK